jgi:hypothetical protein
MVASATTITGKLHQQRKSKTSLFCDKMYSGDKINGKSGGPSDSNVPGRWNDNR